MKRAHFLAAVVIGVAGCKQDLPQQAPAEQQSGSGRSATPATSAGSLGSRSPSIPPADTLTLAYEPATVKLTGVLDTLVRFGPPNFGENPGTDARIVVPILRVDRPFSVRADSGNPANDVDVSNVTVIQLILPPGGRPLPARGTRGTVVGMLSHAISGHHFTDVILTVQRFIAGEEAN